MRLGLMRSRVYISTFSGAILATIITRSTCARAKSVNLSVSLFSAWVFVGKLINASRDTRSQIHINLSKADKVKTAVN